MFCMNKVIFIVLEWNMVTIVLYTSKEHKKPLPKLFLLFPRLIDDSAWKKLMKSFEKAFKSSVISIRIHFQHNDPLNYLWLF